MPQDPLWVDVTGRPSRLKSQATRFPLWGRLVVYGERKRKERKRKGEYREPFVGQGGLSLCPGQLELKGAPPSWRAQKKTFGQRRAVEGPKPSYD